LRGYFPANALRRSVDFRAPLRFAAPGNQRSGGIGIKAGIYRRRIEEIMQAAARFRHLHQGFDAGAGNSKYFAEC
jgi:hypothetical protein